MATNQLDLSILTNQQLIRLLWDLKGTPAAQPLYRELGSRPPTASIKLSDPDRDMKIDQALRQALVKDPLAT